MGRAVGGSARVTTRPTIRAGDGRGPYAVGVPVAVQTPIFEGPFDLLLHLILREEVELYEISLATIVDAYLAELSAMETLDLELATEFLLIASILVELKTKRLLPDVDEADPDDEFGLWEQRDLLLSRLVEAKTFKDASVQMRARMLDAGRSFARCAGPDESFMGLTPDPFAGVGPEDLRRAFFRATRPRPEPVVSLDHVTALAVSVPQAIAEMTEMLARRGRATFRELTDGVHERIEMVVRFLALLELYKQGLAEIDQVRTFGDIEVTWRGGDRSVRADEALVDAYEG
jgi:segregation and condensation protein A